MTDATKPGDAKRLRILVVEDSEDDALLALRTLKRGGFDVAFERVDTLEAMQAALAKGGWDAVLADYGLPGFTGLDALAAFKAAGLDIPFILISGTIGEALAVEAMTGGASDYVMKRSLERLAPALKRELREAAERAARREAERALAERERRLRAIIETEPECVKVVSREGRLLEMNPAGLAMLEASTLAEVQAKPLLEFIAPEHRAAFVALHQRVMDGEAGALEFEVMGLKGRRRWLETHAAPLREGQGSVDALLGITRDVTEQHEAETALRATTEHLRMLVDSSPLAIHTRDREGRVTSWNAAAERMFGWKAEEVLGRPVPAVPDDKREESEELHRLVLAGQPSVQFRGERRRRDGSPIWIDAFLAPLRDARGEIAGVIAVVADDTERVRAERQLRESEERFRSLTELSADWYWEQNEHFRFVSAHGDAEGREQTETLGLTRWEVAGADPADPMWAAHRGVLGRHLPFRDFEYSRVSRDGKARHVSVSGMPLFDAEARFRGYRGVGRDVTARHEAETRIRALNRVYAVLSGINALIVRATTREELLEGACRIAAEQGRFRIAWIGLVDAAAERVRMVACAGDTAGYFESLPARVTDTRPDGRALIGRAVREKRAMVSNDIPADPERKDSPALAGRGVKAIAAIPIVLGGEAVAVMNLLAGERGFFDAEELRLLEELAGDIAYALDGLDRARRLARMTRVNAVRSDINGAIARQRDRQALCQEACRIAVQTGGLPCAWLAVVDRAGERLQPVAIAGGGEEVLRAMAVRLSLRDDAPGGRGLTAMAVRERRALVAADVRTDPRITPAMREFHAARGVVSVATLPLLAGDRALGALILQASDPAFFDEEEMALLEEVAGNIALALDHIEKEEGVRRLTRVYAVLSGINALIVRARERGELLREACRIAVEDAGFRMAWIGEVDRAGQKIEPVAWHGTEPGYIGLMPLGLAEGPQASYGLAGRAVREKRPMVSNDMARDPRVLLGREAVERRACSLAMLPLVRGGEALGVLALYASEIGYFDAGEMRLLEELAGDIAFAMDHIEKSEKVAYLAYYDTLTGLPNRALFDDRFGQALARARETGRGAAIILMDLERFKMVNDSCGRQGGDAVLAELARRAGGPRGRLARVGADQFAFFETEASDEEGLARLAEERWRQLFAEPYRAGDTEVRLSARFGIAVHPADGSDAETLFRHAEAALKRAKAAGERFVFYAPAMTARVAERLRLESRLRLALEREQFVLHYQPKVEAAGGALAGLEALIRWRSPEGLVPPAEFIPVLEETGLVLPVGAWALREAARQHRAWTEQGFAPPRVAVNVSAIQLRQRDFVTIVEAAIRDGVAPTGIDIEITESMVMEDVAANIDKLRAVRALGVRIAIDDFGTGHSSLAYLARLPVHMLKIDRSFVVAMARDADTMTLVSTIVSLAHSLRLKVIAEGVDAEEQAAALRTMGCDQMQGYLFHKPLAADAVAALLEDRSKP